MKTAMFKTDFWKDDGIYGLNKDTRDIYLCLLTNPERDLTPAFKLSDRMLSVYTGYSKEVIDLCRQQLVDADYIEYAEGYYILCEQSYVEPLTGRDSKKIFARDFSKLPTAVVQIIQRRQLLSTPVKSTSSSTSTSTGVIDIPIDINIKETEEFKTAKQLAKRLFNWIKKNYPNREHDEKYLDNWATDIEKLHRIDKKTWEQITEIIDWSQRDGFWHKNIKSGAKLRQKFDSLLDYREDDLKPKDQYGKPLKPYVQHGAPIKKVLEQQTSPHPAVQRANQDSEAYKKYLAKKAEILAKKGT